MVKVKDHCVRLSYFVFKSFYCLPWGSESVSTSTVWTPQSLRTLTPTEKKHQSDSWYIYIRRSYQIALKQGNQNPQDNMIASFSFASTAHVTQWLNYLTQRAEILTPRSNLTPQEEHCKWFVPGVCGTKVTFEIKQVGFTASLFSRDQQAVVGTLLWMEVILANTSLLLNTYTLRKKNDPNWSRTWSIS